MKCISRAQYDYLVAIESGDEEAIGRIEGLLPNNGELYHRHLYTGNLVSNEEFEYGSLKITQSGKDALMCYRALSLSTILP